MLRELAARLSGRAGDLAEARLEAEVLAAHVLCVERRQVWALAGIDLELARRLEQLVARREAHAVPVAYLTGRRGFHELDLLVDPRVLVPRPETELLVERLLAREAAGCVPAGPWLDWGTGSGCVALSLASARPVLAVDRSLGALAVAAQNRAALQPRRAVQLLAADGLSAVREASLAAIAANPPYISADDWARLDDDVRCHEPRSALVPADDDVAGLYRRLGDEALRCLLPGGWLLAEVGAGQARQVAELWQAAGLELQAISADLAGIERVVEARRPAAGTAANGPDYST